MMSLKAFLANVAPQLGMTAAGLYERQRALVRLGILQPAGRGPGRGILASTDSVAVLLISLGAAEGLSEIDRRIITYCEAPSVSKTCPLTGEKNIRDALSKCLCSDDILARIEWISFAHIRRPLATITFRSKKGSTEASFFQATDGQNETGMKISTQFSKQLLVGIAKSLQEVVGEGTS
jgi:hypothetical protein